MWRQRRRKFGFLYVNTSYFISFLGFIRQCSGSWKCGGQGGVARTKILLLFVSTGSKWEETVKSSGAPLSPRQRPRLWLVESSHPVRSGAQGLAEAENFRPMRDAVTVLLGQDSWVNSQNRERWQNQFNHQTVSRSAYVLNDLLGGEWSNKRWLTRYNLIVWWMWSIFMKSHTHWSWSEFFFVIVN